MKKYLPFASLKEQAIMLHAMEEEKKKVEKPIISDDTKEEINRILSNYDGKKLVVYYFDRGYIKSHISVIKKIDVFNQTLLLHELSIAFQNILNIKEEN